MSKNWENTYKEQRNKNIIALRKSGYTLREIADHFGVSFQRIHEITKGIEPDPKPSIKTAIDNIKQR